MRPPQTALIDACVEGAFFLPILIAQISTDPPAFLTYNLDNNILIAIEFLDYNRGQCVLNYMLLSTVSKTFNLIPPFGPRTAAWETEPITWRSYVRPSPTDA
jgi:hypothetical protein